MCCLSLYEYNLLDSTFPSLVPECQQSRQKGIKVNVCFSTLGKHLTEKTIYILIAFFHYINSSSAFHPGGGMNVCKLLASIRIKETLELSRGSRGHNPPSYQHWNCFSVWSPFKTCGTQFVQNLTSPDQVSYAEQEVAALEFSLDPRSCLLEQLTA